MSHLTLTHEMKNGGVIIQLNFSTEQTWHIRPYLFPVLFFLPPTQTPSPITEDSAIKTILWVIGVVLLVVAVGFPL